MRCGFHSKPEKYTMKRLILIGIIILAVFFRFYALSRVPPAPSLDEVSIGYNAYSILRTGKDEYGTPYPMLLRAYDDYRPALYVYLTIPFVKIFGLTAVSVRLPSVLLSVLTVYLVYSIGRMIGKKYCSYAHLGDIAGVLLAISPWHIYISRLGHEANLGLTLFVLGIYLFLQAVLLEKKSAWIWSAIVFAMSLHGYQSDKIISPLILISGVIAFHKEIWHARRHVLAASALGVLIALPAVLAAVSPEGLLRFRGTSAFSPDSPDMVAATKAYVSAREKGDTAGKLLYGKAGAYVRIFTKNYVSHFAPGWVFAGADREAHKVPGMGLLYLWEAPFLLLGLWALIKSKLPAGLKWFVFSWILISPVPAAVTTQSPHAMRAYALVPAALLVEALGFWWMIRRFSARQLQILAAVVGVIVAQGITVFWRGYFVRFPAEQSDSFQYALKSAVSYAGTQAGSYDAVQFSNQGSLYQSYMFFLYYTKFNPADYQATGGTVSGGYEEAHYIGKYAFGVLPQKPAEFAPKTLYFYDAKQLPPGLRTLETFYTLDGSPAIFAATL